MADTGFYVIMEEVAELENEILEKAAERASGLESAGQSVNNYIAYLDGDASGMLAETIRNYFAEVHLYAISGLYAIQTELMTRMLQYGEGLFEIESSEEGAFREEELQEQATGLDTQRGELTNIVEDADTALGKIPDLFVRMPSTEGLEGYYGTLITRVNTLEEKVADYESAHMADLDTLDEMISCMRQFIAGYLDQPEGSMESYRSGSILERPETVRMNQLAEQQEAYFARQAEEINRLQEQRVERFLLEAREQESRNKILKGVIIVSGAVLSIGAIVFSWGAATPAVTTLAGKLLVTGNTISMAYGTAETVEGLNMAELAAQGDVVTTAFNPIRDSVPLFKEHPELYYILGETSTAFTGWGMEVSGVCNVARTMRMPGVKQYAYSWAVSEVVEEVSTGYMINSLGMSPEEAWMASMVLGTGICEGASFRMGKAGWSRSVLELDMPYRTGLTDAGDTGYGWTRYIAGEMAGGTGVDWKRYIAVETAGDTRVDLDWYREEIMKNTTLDDLMQQDRKTTGDTGVDLKWYTKEPAKSPVWDEQTRQVGKVTSDTGNMLSLSGLGTLGRMHRLKPLNSIGRTQQNGPESVRKTDGMPELKKSGYQDVLNAERPREVSKGGSKTRIFREATQQDADLISDIKTRYNAGKTRNAASAKGTINGESIDLECISGKFSHDNYYNKGNFEPPQSENYHYQGPIPEYTNHTEQKIVEYLREQFKDNPNVSGEIEIISERIYCDNCKALVDMFENEFPNIKVTRVDVVK